MTENCSEAFQRLPELPDSAETVFCRLYHRKPMTGKQLRDETGLPRRTLYTALQRLKDAGVLKEQVSLRDSRQSYYWIDEQRIGHPEEHVERFVARPSEGVAAGAA